MHCANVKPISSQSPVEYSHMFEKSTGELGNIDLTRFADICATRIIAGCTDFKAPDDWARTNLAAYIVQTARERGITLSETVQALSLIEQYQDAQGHTGPLCEKCGVFRLFLSAYTVGQLGCHARACITHDRYGTPSVNRTQPQLFDLLCLTESMGPKMYAATREEVMEAYWSELELEEARDRKRGVSWIRRSAKNTSRHTNSPCTVEANATSKTSRRTQSSPSRIFRSMFKQS